MSKKFTVIVIDSFGVGSMDDCVSVRPQDIGTNTAFNLINNEKLSLPNLQKLGIMNAIGKETATMKKSETAKFAISNLMHYGADTFFGHQEIMGTKPTKPVNQKFAEKIDEVERKLRKHGFETTRFSIDGVQALVVNEAIFVGDNMETDLGQAINVSGTFDKCTFDDVKAVGNIVRSCFQVPRIIALGGESVSLETILNSAFQKDGFIGLDTPKSELYNKGYCVVHIGYGVDSKIQLPEILNKVNVKTYLYGKVADIVENENGVSYFGVDTATLLDKLIEDYPTVDNAFMCLNVQETDLAGHQCDFKEYSNVLQIVDEKLGVLMKLMDKNDVLIVMADHGNDPYTKRSQHTRECVPILIVNNNIASGFFGKRATMSDVGATVAKYFATTIQNGVAIF